MPSDEDQKAVKALELIKRDPTPSGQVRPIAGLLVTTKSTNGRSGKKAVATTRKAETVPTERPTAVPPVNETRQAVRISRSPKTRMKKDWDIRAIDSNASAFACDMPEIQRG